VRWCISLPEELDSKLSELLLRRGYSNRSEAVRDFIRDALVEDAWKKNEGELVGILSLVYDHKVRALSDKLTGIQHHYHHAIISTLHIHLDEHNCLEVLILRSRAPEIQDIANSLISVRGVKHGKLLITSGGKELD